MKGWDVYYQVGIFNVGFCPMRARAHTHTHARTHTHTQSLIWLKCSVGSVLVTHDVLNGALSFVSQ